MKAAKQHVTFVEREGRKFYFLFGSADDHLCKVIEETGNFYEHPMLDALARLLRKGDTVLDVGANVGTHTVYFAGLLGCRVVAFEPVAGSVELLRENVRLNGLESQVQVETVALGERAGHAEVAVENESNSGATRLRTADEGALEVQALDDRLDALAPVRVMKIDVEGMEADVLRGATRLIGRDRPTIACECLDGAQFAEVNGVLADLGYVAVDVFNASPTYVFLPTEQIGVRPELASFLGGTVLRGRQETQRAARNARSALGTIESQARQLSDLQGLVKAGADMSARFTAEVAALREELRTARAELDNRKAGEQAVSERIDALTGRLASLGDDVSARLGEVHAVAATLRASAQSHGDRLAALEGETPAQQAAAQKLQQTQRALDSLKAEHGSFILEMRRRMTRAERRHDKLLNGRVFGSLRRFKRVLQRFGLFRDAPGSLDTGSEASQKPAGVGKAKGTGTKTVSGSGSMSGTTEGKASSASNPSAAAASLPRPEKVPLAGVSYMTRPQGTPQAAQRVHEGTPLISVVMTAYNTGELIKPAIESILAQTWNNLELIVIDDCSTDNTRALVESFALRDERVKLYCFGVNRGTYWCKNFGITVSSGVAVTFMDSDDTSAPDRLRQQFNALNRPGYAVSTCNHVRIDESGQIVSINGVAERVAYISQMVKREVFDEIGFFDSVRTSADDEFLRRLKLTYGVESHTNVKGVLYTALLRDGSLTRDPENAINFVQSRNPEASFLSPQRRHYSAMVNRWHQYLTEKGLRPYMPFPVVRRPFPVFGKLRIAEETYDGNLISVCLASYPPRREKLKQVVESLLPQADRLYVYLNEYEEVPDFLRHSRITVELGGADANLRDNGKFFFASTLPRGYCFTVDDDIVYPPDYVQTLIRKLEFYERQVVVGLHGTVFAQPMKSYFTGRKVMHFEHELPHDSVVHQLGTGTCAFHTDLLRPPLSTFQSTGMADVWFSLFAKKHAVPMIALARAEGWLHPIGYEEVTLFREFRRDDKRHTQIVRKAEPWTESLVGAAAATVARKRAAYGTAFERLLPQPAISTSSKVPKDAPLSQHGEEPEVPKEPPVATTA